MKPNHLGTKALKLTFNHQERLLRLHDTVPRAISKPFSTRNAHQKPPRGHRIGDLRGRDAVLVLFGALPDLVLSLNALGTARSQAPTVLMMDIRASTLPRT